MGARTGLVVGLTVWMLSLSGEALAAGEEVDGFPNWEERVYLQLTNRARVAPELEMEACGDNCPDAACYSVQPPLRHDPLLARASRFHAQEMEVRGFFSHTSNCTLVDDIDERWPETCDGSAECACEGGVAECTGGSCTSAQHRVGRFGAGYGGEVSVGVSNPHFGFYLWLHEPSTSEECVFGNGNGHRWLLMTKQGNVGFGAYGGYGNGDFGFGGASDDHPIASGAHYPRAGSSVDVWASWYDEAPPTMATVDVDGTCIPMELERGDELNGTYALDLDGLSAQDCTRYFFVFKDAAGETVTYPSTGSLGIGPAESCAAWSEERPVQGDGCDCVPVCDGLSCGDDGCGGSCGACGEGQSCEVGECVDLPDEPDPEDDGGEGEDDGGDPDGGTGTGGEEPDEMEEPDFGDDDGEGEPGLDDENGSLPPGFGHRRGTHEGCRVGGSSAPWWMLVLPVLAWRRRSRR